MRPRIHLISPAGSCRPFLDALKIHTAGELIKIVSDTVGPGFDVSANQELIEAGEHEARGGRTDDSLRAADLTEALACDDVAALVLIRGGAWFTRVLPHVEFTVLEKRTRPVAVFGFSEMTTLVNIVGGFAQARGVYDMGPAFLTYALKRHAAVRTRFDVPAESRPASWMRERLRPELATFFQDVVRIIEGRGTQRHIRARVARGDVGDAKEATFVGGNLTVLSTLVGSVFDDTVRPAGRWLVLEDFNDKLERIDRFLAHLTLAGYWDGCAGLLLGDFHRGYDDLTPAVLELLPYHLPPNWKRPVLVTEQVGHVWPMSPLPLHAPLRLESLDDGDIAISWPDELLQTV